MEGIMAKKQTKKLKDEKLKEPETYFQTHLDLAKTKDLIIDIDQAHDDFVNVRIDSDNEEFSFALSENDLRKLAIIILRYFKGETGTFYHDKFNIGSGDARREIPAKKILDQYPF
jgi:hypothetical protein